MSWAISAVRRLSSDSTRIPANDMTHYRARVRISPSSWEVRAMGLPFTLLEREAFSTNAGDMLRRDTVSAQPTDLERTAEFGYPACAVFGGGIRMSGKDPCHCLVASGGRDSCLPGPQRANVHLHGVRQQRGAYGAVGRGKHSADGRGKSVNHAQRGVGQREPAEQAGHRHVRASFAIVAIAPNPR